MIGIGIRSVLGAAILMFFFRCSPDQVAGGTSTSENGRVTGTIVSTDGGSKARTEVTLVPAAFNPLHDSAAFLTDTTDSAGRFYFTLKKPGEFTVQSVHLDNRTRAAAWGIRVNNDTVLVPDDTLTKPGSVRIALFEDTESDSMYVFIPGTTLSVKVATDRSVTVLDSVPAGTIPEVVYASRSSLQPNLLRSAVDVTSGTAATIHHSGWKHTRNITLNTTASGAGIAETVQNFPVLIRLTGNNFDFSQALLDGTDLRFTKQNGAPLPFDIERWDPVAELAEVWVKADTIYGNRSDQTLSMYWGNPQASSKIAYAVFDTSAGFAAVWHLGESADSLYDATPNSYHGVKMGKCRQNAGIIGKCLYFDTAESYAEMGNVLNLANGNLTASAWIKRSGTGLQTIFAKSSGSSPSSEYGWTLSFGQTDQLHFFAANGGSSWGNDGAFDFWAHEDSAVTDSLEWHFVAVVLDRTTNGNCRTFIDGVDVTGSYNGDISKLGSPLNESPFRIGAEADGQYQWTGFIDECVLSHTVRSGAWLRLSFVNQSADDRLITFE